MALHPNTRVGPYEVTAQIGVSGMGQVYRATDTNLRRQVAIVWRRSIPGRVSSPDSDSSGGLSLEEPGEVVRISIATAERDWQAARAWLLKELKAERRHDA